MATSEKAAEKKKEPKESINLQAPLHLKLEVLGHILHPFWALLVDVKRVFRSDGTAVAYSVKGTLDTMKYYKHVHVTVVSCNIRGIDSRGPCLIPGDAYICFLVQKRQNYCSKTHITPRKSAEWNSPGKMFQKAHGNSSHMGCVMVTCDHGAS